MRPSDLLLLLTRLPDDLPPRSSPAPRTSSRRTRFVFLLLSSCHRLPELTSFFRTLTHAQVNGTTLPERTLLAIFHGTLLAVRAMHTYHTGPQASYPPSPAAAGPSSAGAGAGRGGIRSDAETTEEEGDDGEGEGLTERGEEGEGQALIGGLEGVQARLEEEAGESVPGMGEDGGLVMGRLGAGEGHVKSQERKSQPWAHRDIKPVRSPSSILYRSFSSSL